MKKLASVAVCAVFATAGFAPAAFAKHRHHHAAHAAVAAPVANPEFNEKGEFYATPVSAGPANLAPELGTGPIPGLNIATAVVGGVAQPALAVPGAVLAVPGTVLAPIVPQ